MCRHGHTRGGPSTSRTDPLCCCYGTVLFLLRRLTKTRSTSGCSATVRMNAISARTPIFVMMCFPSAATKLGAEISTRSSALSTRSGIGMNQMSTSSPIWWLLCPNGSGTPRGCAMSPIRIPFQPVASAASGAKRSKNCTSSGWPQLRLRDTRITCQVGPVVGQFDPPLKTTARVVADCHGSAEAWQML